MSTSFIPLGNRILIEPQVVAKVTTSGIHIPESAIAEMKQDKGIVIACGQGLPGEPMTIKVGDLVMYNENLTKDFQLGGKTYLMTRESDLIGYFE